MSAILVTGATGFVGSYITEELLARGYDVVGLVRSGEKVTPYDRTLARIIEIQNANGQRPFERAALWVVEGDILKEFCGIGDEQIASLRKRQVGLLIHVAAETQFRERLDDPRIMLTNVTGTRNTLALARQLGVQDFCHISTAYVGGKRDCIPEALFEMGENDFNNAYEASKWEAEQLVSQFCQEHDISWTIARPSIIVGHSRTGHTFLFNGYYTMVYSFWAKPPKIATIPGDPNANLPITPIDFVASAIAELIEQGQDRCGVFNVLPKIVHTAKWWLDQTTRFFNLRQLEIGQPPKGIKDRITRQFLRLMPPDYLVYLKSINWSTDRFQRVSVDQPLIDERFVDTILSFAVAQRFGQAK